MIKSVMLKNFRGLTTLEIPLSSVTMLTGVNGVGKSSVLEGLYCLFSQTRLDVSHLPRYNKSLGYTINRASNMPIVYTSSHNYNYNLFWDECPSYGKNDCYVEAISDNNLVWSWEYKRAKLSDLDRRIFENNPLQVDASSEFALWNWQTRGKIINNETHQVQDVNKSFQRAQLLSQDGGLYLLPIEMQYMSICQYIDFASIRLHPQKLSFQTAKQLTKALRIINPSITDVRLKDVQSGLSVILDDSVEVSLGAIGNGAVTWASALIMILDVIEAVKNQQPEIPIIILVDEMGAGIHYSIILDVWKFINEFRKQNCNIQFVFTSHSDDCIRAFCEAFLNQEEASVIRLHQTSVEKQIVYNEYKKDVFAYIIDGDWEVRG